MSYLYQKLNHHSFREAFKDHGRSDQYTPEALEAIFDYLEGIAECGESIELDVISICCDFSEVAAKDLERETNCSDLDALNDETWALELDNGNFLYIAF